MAKHFIGKDQLDDKIVWSSAAPLDIDKIWVNEGYSPTPKFVNLLEGITLTNAYVSDINGLVYSTSVANEFSTGFNFINVSNVDSVTLKLLKTLPDTPTRGGIQGYDSDKNFIKTLLPHQVDKGPYQIDIDTKGIDYIKANLWRGNTYEYRLITDKSQVKFPVIFLYNKTEKIWENVSGIDYFIDREFKKAIKDTGIEVKEEVSNVVTDLLYILDETCSKLPPAIQEGISEIAIYQKADGVFGYSTSELGGVYINNFYQQSPPDEVALTGLFFHEVGHTVDGHSFNSDKSNSLSRDESFAELFEIFGDGRPVFEVWASVFQKYFSDLYGYEKMSTEERNLIKPYMEKVIESNYQLPLIN